MRAMSVPIVLGAIGCASAVHAQALTVNAGSHVIQAQPNQVISIHVSGGAEILGADLVLQIGDGVAGPIITGVDLESGIFLSNHTGQSGDISLGRTAFYSITADSEPVIGEGLWAQIELDASGVPEGTYSLGFGPVEYPGFGTIESVFFSPTVITVPTDFISGTITVVPEPSALLGAIALSAIAPLRRRRM